MDLPHTGRLLAVDWGEIRIGLAASDEGQILASPLTTLTRRRGKRFPTRALLEQVETVGAVGVVLGLPLAPDGTDSEATTAVRAIAERLEPLLDVPLVLWDERLTTARALRAVQELGGSLKGRREDLDALAASVLLQHFMDSRESD